MQTSYPFGSELTDGAHDSHMQQCRRRGRDLGGGHAQVSEVQGRGGPAMGPSGREATRIRRNS